MPLSRSLIAAVAIQLGCQLFKVFYYSARDRRFSFHWFFSAGGMPSAHTAFVTALAVSVGLYRGFSSETFAVAFVFATIVVYDILRVRAAVQAHTDVLEALLAERAPWPAGTPDAGDRPGGEPSPAVGPAVQPFPPLPPGVGHTRAEVLVGLVVGALAAAGLFFVMAPS
jgi:acid phosphatase family membrane protein YuiD